MPSFIPTWPWYYWAIGTLTVLLFGVLEGSYRLSKSERPKREYSLPPSPAPPTGLPPNDFDRLVPDLRLADCAAAQDLFKGQERQKILALLVAEKLTAWGRPMGPSGEPDLVRLSGKQWETHSVFWYPPSQGLVSQTFFRTKARDESKFYDVHLNSVQVRQVWPDLDLSTDPYVPLYQAAQEAYDSNERLASIVRKLCHELSQDIIGWYCELLRPRIKIYGRQPPSDKIVEAKLEGFSFRVEN